MKSSEFEKAGSTGSAEPKSVLFSAKFLQNFTKFTKNYQILPKFIISYQMFTKFVTDAVLLQFQIVVIYAFFPRQICIPNKSGLTTKLLFPTLEQLGNPEFKLYYMADLNK